MDNKKFSAIYSNWLDVKEVFALSKSTIDLTKAFGGKLGVISQAAFTTLCNQTEALGISLNRNQKSAFTDEIKNFDIARDSDIISILGIIRSYLKSNNPAKREAALALQQFIMPYKRVNRLPMDVQSGVVHELIRKSKASDDILFAALNIGLGDFFTSLETNNKEFDRLYNERTIERASRGASASSIKPKCVSAYVQFCTAIEQEIVFAPNNQLIMLFRQLDELRKQYRTSQSGNKK